MKKISARLATDNEARLYIILLGVTALTVLALALFRDFDRDEFEAVHTAWKLLNGEHIYIDFFQHHHPFFYYALTPIISLVGESTSVLIALRVLNFMFFLGMLWCTYKITDLFFDRVKVSLLATLFLSSMTMFSQKAIEIRPDVPQVLLGLLALLYLIEYVNKGRKWMQLLSSFFLGLSFLFLQKTVFIVAGLGLTQFYLIYKNRFTFKQLIIYWVSFISVISPYYLYLILNDQLSNYFFWNWTINMHFEESFSPFRTILDSFYYNHFIWLFYIVGLVICVKRDMKVIPILSILLLLTVFLAKAPYRQYFMPFLPLMCGVSAYGVLNLLSLRLKYLVTVLACLVPMVFYVRTMLVYPNTRQIDKINWVLEHTRPNDFVYDGKPGFNLFRKDIDFFWYSTEPNKGGLATFKKLKPYTYDIYNLIESKEPQVISNLFIDSMSHIKIRDQYEQSKAYEGLYVRLEDSLPD